MHETAPAPSPDPRRDDDEIAALLGPGGAIARTFEAAGGLFESRPQQGRMASAVLAALSSRRHLVAEAGTGVGKTFAYLVPALLWAARTGRRVAVATSTIALQEQLVRKDLPLLRRALPIEVEWALVKGRGNYLCLRRLGAAVAAASDLFPDADARRELMGIRDWAEATRDGTRQDLPFAPSEEVWDQVRAEAGNCLYRKCPHYAVCRYQRARRDMRTARLLVLNHHVLVSDLALKRSGSRFLPEIDAVVIDEAHDFEDTASEHLGLRVTAGGVAVALGRLWSRRGTGLLRLHPDRRLRDDVEAARDASRAFFDGVRSWAEGAGPEAGAGRAVRYGDRLPVEDAVGERLRRLADALGNSVSTAPTEDQAHEFAARASGLEAVATTLDALVAGPADGDVRWVEASARGSVAICAAPVDVGARLKEVLWEKVGTAVLTSATLATGSPPSFAFLRSRLGLADADEAVLGSPFDYPRQARLVVRTDLPDPSREGARYDAALPGAVLEAVRRSRGGAFVLFTSLQSMRAVAAALRADLEADGLVVLVQGEGVERSALLERFRETNAVLFGVASFWQGVDVPGDALRHVVIARLPFEVPTHPLHEARSERVEREGGDAFADLALPAAALRLKQGFGRLIRSGTDRGLVTILDSRIATKSYGRFLLGSLPECPVEFVPEPAT